MSVMALKDQDLELDVMPRYFGGLQIIFILDYKLLTDYLPNDWNSQQTYS